MKNKIYDSYDAAVADIPDGSTIMFPGFGGVGSPENLIIALNRQGAKQLTGISNGTGGGGGGGGASGVGALIEARQMKKMICAFTAPTHPSRTTPFIDQYNADEIDAELVPQGTLAERMRAAGAGIGAFFTPTAKLPPFGNFFRTDLSTSKMCDDGRLIGGLKRPLLDLSRSRNPFPFI